VLAGRVAIGGRTIRDPGHHVNAGDRLTLEVPPPEEATPQPEDIGRFFQRWTRVIPTHSPPPTGLPAGQTQHYTGPSATGWVVVAVWDSKGAWDEFRDKTLLPGLQGLGDSGLAGPPKGTEFDDEAS